MPTYSYKCKTCEHAFDVQQSLSEDALSNCPKCSGALVKVFGNVGVTFKGSGFYKTDSAGTNSPAGKSGDSAAKSN